MVGVEVVDGGESVRGETARRRSHLGDGVCGDGLQVVFGAVEQGIVHLHPVAGARRILYQVKESIEGV